MNIGPERIDGMIFPPQADRICSILMSEKIASFECQKSGQRMKRIRRFSRLIRSDLALGVVGSHGMIWKALSFTRWDEANRTDAIVEFELRESQCC